MLRALSFGREQRVQKGHRSLLQQQQAQADMPQKECQDQYLNSNQEEFRCTTMMLPTAVTLLKSDAQSSAWLASRPGELRAHRSRQHHQIHQNDRLLYVLPHFKHNSQTQQSHHLAPHHPICIHPTTSRSCVHPRPQHALELSVLLPPSQPAQARASTIPWSHKPLV